MKQFLYGAIAALVLVTGLGLAYLWPIATFIKRITDLPPAVRESLAVRPKH